MYALSTGLLARCDPAHGGCTQPSSITKTVVDILDIGSDLDRLCPYKRTGRPEQIPILGGLECLCFPQLIDDWTIQGEH